MVQRPGQGLENRLYGMMRIAPVMEVYMKINPSVTGKSTQEFLHEFQIEPSHSFLG